MYSKNSLFFSPSLPPSQLCSLSLLFLKTTTFLFSRRTRWVVVSAPASCTTCCYGNTMTPAMTPWTVDSPLTAVVTEARAANCLLLRPAFRPATRPSPGNSFRVSPSLCSTCKPWWWVPVLCFPVHCSGVVQVLRNAFSLEIWHPPTPS